jgi:hypothetical protein
MKMRPTIDPHVATSEQEACLGNAVVCPDWAERFSAGLRVCALVAGVIGLPTAAFSQQNVAVAIPARAGAVEGTAENSDAFIWRLFTGFVAPVSKSSPSPVVFESWASDKDTFSANPHGAQTPVVAPNRTQVNSQYGSCSKSAPLTAMMASANLASVWQHYCLKSTEVDYTAADGTPYALDNSVIEGIVGNGTVAASSCISCHAYASFGQDGKPSPAATAILPFNPTGKPIPEVFANAHTFAFMWCVLLAPP